MDNDIEMLRAYAERGSEEAFQNLVRKHIGMVYRVSLRHVNGDRALAEDACQLVFNDLARKAKSVDPNTIMTGWLYRHAFHTASRIARTEKRRRIREDRYATDQAVDASETSDAAKENLRSLADRLLSGLREKDRAAVLLRFYEGRSYSEIGAVLGMSTDAAEKRISRSVERIRRRLRLGTASATGLLIAGLVSPGDASDIPASLAVQICGRLPGQVSVLSVPAALPSYAVFLKTAVAALLVGTVCALLLMEVSKESESSTEAHEENALRDQNMTSETFPAISETGPHEGVFVTYTGFMRTILELDGGRFRYWFLSDAKRLPEPDYPLEGNYSIANNRVLLAHPDVSVLQSDWTFRDVNGIVTLWRRDALETPGKGYLDSYPFGIENFRRCGVGSILVKTDRRAEIAWAEPQYVEVSEEDHRRIVRESGIE